MKVLVRPNGTATSSKGAGPIVVAAAFVLAVGGLAAAAILLCGWQQVKSVGFNMAQKRIEIQCK